MKKTQHKFQDMTDIKTGRSYAKCQKCGFEMEYGTNSSNVTYTSEFFFSSDYLKCKPKQDAKV